MADLLQFELVSPEAKLASTEAEAVTIPAQLGELTAMAHHAPFLTTLRPGYVVVTGSERARYFVTGGFAEISDNTVSVLAEEALAEDDVSAEWLSEKIEAAKKVVEDAGEERRQIEAQRLADLEQLAARA